MESCTLNVHRIHRKGMRRLDKAKLKIKKFRQCGAIVVAQMQRRQNPSRASQANNPRTPMKLHRLFTVAVCLALTTLAARAEVSEIKIGRPGSVAFLPLMVMEHQKLMEKHAKAAGLGEMKVSYAV